jgi:hypothetical protein
MSKLLKFTDDIKLSTESVQDKYFINYVDVTVPAGSYYCDAQAYIPDGYEFVMWLNASPTGHTAYAFFDPLLSNNSKIWLQATSTSDLTWHCIYLCKRK